MTELKKWITTALLTLLLLPAMAQQLPVRSAEGYVLCSLEWE